MLITILFHKIAGDLPENTAISFAHFLPPPVDRCCGHGTQYIVMMDESFYMFLHHRLFLEMERFGKIKGKLLFKPSQCFFRV